MASTTCDVISHPSSILLYSLLQGYLWPPDIPAVVHSFIQKTFRKHPCVLAGHLGKPSPTSWGLHSSEGDKDKQTREQMTRGSETTSTLKEIKQNNELETDGGESGGGVVREGSSAETMSELRPECTQGTQQPAAGDRLQASRKALGKG